MSEKRLRISYFTMELRTTFLDQKGHVVIKGFFKKCITLGGLVGEEPKLKLELNRLSSCQLEQYSAQTMQKGWSDYV
jgi:hypothetical protein